MTLPSDLGRLLFLLKDNPELFSGCSFLVVGSRAQFLGPFSGQDVLMIVVNVGVIKNLAPRSLPKVPAFFTVARNLKLLLAQPKIGVCCIQ